MHRHVKNFNASPPQLKQQQQQQQQLPKSPSPSRPSEEEQQQHHEPSPPRPHLSDESRALVLVPKKNTNNIIKNNPSTTSLSLSPPQDRSRQRLVPLTSRASSTNAISVSALAATSSPTTARLLSNSGFSARDVVMEIQRGGMEQSLVHSTGIAKKNLPPLAVELASFVRREVGLIDRQQQQLSPTTTSKKKKNSSSNSSSSVVHRLESKLSVARETLSCIAAHFPAYNEVFSIIIGTLSSGVADCAQLAISLSDLALLQKSSDSLVEASLSEARDAAAAREAALIVEREQLKLAVADLEHQLKVATGNVNYEKRAHLHTKNSLESMKKRCLLFETSMKEETERSIKLTHRLSRLTNTNVALRDNINFLDKLLHDAEDEVEKLVGSGKKNQQQEEQDLLAKKKTKKMKKKSSSSSNQNDDDEPPNVRKLLAEMNRKQMKSVLKDSDFDDDDDDQHQKKKSADAASGSDSDSGRSVVSTNESSSSNNSNSGSDDDDDFDNPISSRADRRVIRGVGQQRHYLVSIDTQLKKLVQANEQLSARLHARERELAEKKQQLAERNEEMTPRPSWLRARDQLPHFMLDPSASSEECLDDLLLAFRAELESQPGRSQASRHATGTVVQEWLRTEQLSESDIAAAARSSKFFIARGSAPSVPVFLRTPCGTHMIPNRRLSKFAVESCLKKFWSARRAELGVPTSEQIFLAHRISNRKERNKKLKDLRQQQRQRRIEMGSERLLPLDYFFADFCSELTGSTIHGLTLAYNIWAVVSANLADPDCLSLVRCLSGEISESAAICAEDVVSVVRGSLEAASSGGHLSKSSVQRLLLGLFPHKSKEDHLRLRCQLALSAAEAAKGKAAPSGQNMMINLRALFSEDEQCNESAFVTELRLQELDSYVLYSLEVESALRSAFSAGGFIRPVEARDVIRSEVDPGVPEEVLDEIVSAAGNLPLGSSALRDESAQFPLEPALERIKRNVLLKRYAAPNNKQQHYHDEDDAEDERIRRRDPSAFDDILTKSAAALTFGTSTSIKARPKNGEDDDGFFDFMEKIAEEEEKNNDDDELEEVESIGEDEEEDADESSEQQQQQKGDLSGSDPTSPSSPPPSEQQEKKSTNRRAAILRRSFRRRQEESQQKSDGSKNKSTAVAKLEREMAKQRREQREQERAEREEDNDAGGDDDGGERKTSRRQSVVGMRRMDSSSWQRPLIFSESSSDVGGAGSGGGASVAKAAAEEETFRRTYTMYAKQQQEARRKSTVVFEDDDE